MQKIINFVKNPYKWYTDRKESQALVQRVLDLQKEEEAVFQTRLDELRKRDPFIYK
jgi:hypothetical protein